MIQILLPIHILAGTIALLCAALAVSSEKGKRLHVLSGRTYFWGTVVNKSCLLASMSLDLYGKSPLQHIGKMKINVAAKTTVMPSTPCTSDII